MALHPLAGKPAPDDILINPTSLLEAYEHQTPDPGKPEQKVSFGTSGHRGCSLNGSFNKNHILAITQAVCEYRKGADITGPLFMGMDTHALSKPAQDTALRVLLGNGIQTVIQRDGGFTPTPVISHLILAHNRNHNQKADGIVITPSHNPPGDGGFKYNPPSGGPAEGAITSWIQNRANQLLENQLTGVCQASPEDAPQLFEARDFVEPYVADLVNVVDIEAIQGANIKLGVDPLGGAGLPYWQAIQRIYGLNLEIVNDSTDPTFRFMTLDKDGKIRMDCSSPHAMAGLLKHKDRFDLAFGNDPDADRHGIVTPDGLMNPNHYLAVAIHYLFKHRPNWPKSAKVGKTLVSSAIIDRVAASIGCQLSEVPVGFKWFVDGLLTSEYGFGGEESAGASFLRLDGSVWTTDKDGFILCLLAAEISVKTGKNPSQYYTELTQAHGTPVYERLDAPASAQQKALLSKMSPDQVTAQTLAGEPILKKLTRAPGNDAEIGGLKVVTENGWFAARPSGTEDIYKIYTESFKGQAHLKQIQEEAIAMVQRVFDEGLVG